MLITLSSPKPLFSYKPFWAKRFGTATILPMSRDEMDILGWDSCDIILVTGDAYIDHPSFGAAIIGRLLEAQGFRVGIIAQPDWQSAEAFKTLGQPNLFFGVTAGNMDSMVNRYTADRKRRSDDAYSPDNQGGKRPDRSVIVYSQRCKQAYPGVPVILGGIEASLRRIAHYDYWQDKIRRSILLDAKADYLCYGNAERAIVGLAHAMAGNRDSEDVTSLRGVGFATSSIANDRHILDASSPDNHVPNQSPEGSLIKLPSYDQVVSDPRAYAHSVRLLYRETNPYNARTLIQYHDKRIVQLNPPAQPLSTEELDQLYALPFSRKAHPLYGESKFPALEMIRHSVNIMRGCFGGCSFCSLTIHEGRMIQSRSVNSAIHEIETIRDNDPSFTGVISDLGGPSANMYRLNCKDPKALKTCRRLSCLYPKICPNLDTDHTALIELYRQARSINGIKKINIASGVRYDLAIASKAYIKELVSHHVGGYLKIAPEHTESQPLKCMMKPSIECYHEFEGLFRNYSAQAGKEQYMIPYFIAGHPGSTDNDMLNLALWLKRNKFRPDQVQAFYPTPLTLASTSYATGLDLNDPKLNKRIYIPKGEKQRRIQKAFMRYHSPENQKLLVETLITMGRKDLIGFSKHHLVKPLKGEFPPSKKGGGDGATSRKGAPSKQGGKIKPSQCKVGKPRHSSKRK